MRELALVVLVCMAVQCVQRDAVKEEVMFDIYFFFFAIFCSFTAKPGVEKGVILAVFCADKD